ncbi:ABC transporter permease [Oceanimonas sp. NS1]|nr:ABC transporter permease [Oceanimonas sp. NS1]
MPALTLLALLVLELLGIGLIGASAGLISGAWLAKALLPDVAATLQSLYGARVSASLNLPWHYWLGGMGVTLGGLVVAAGGVLWRASRLPLLGLGQAQAWRSGFERQLGCQARLGVMAALLALVCGLVLWGSPPARACSPGLAWWRPCCWPRHSVCRRCWPGCWCCYYPGRDRGHSCNGPWRTCSCNCPDCRWP